MTTPKLELPELVANQAQPHVPHNSALRRLDALVQLRAVDRAISTPPGSPSDGDVYIVGAAASGAWSGFAEDSIAAYIGTAWVEITPADGWWCWVADESVFYVYDSTASPAGWTLYQPGGDSVGDITADPAWTDAGDLVVGTGASAAAVLPIGSALQVLRVDAVGTALEWADASSLAFSAQSYSVFFSGVPGNGQLVGAWMPKSGSYFYVEDMDCQARVGPADNGNTATIDVHIGGSKVGELIIDSSGYGYGTDTSSPGGPHYISGGALIEFYGQATADSAMADVTIGWIDTAPP